MQRLGTAAGALMCAGLQVAGMLSAGMSAASAQELPSVRLRLGMVSYNDRATVPAGQESRVDVLGNDRIPQGQRPALRIIKADECLQARVENEQLIVNPLVSCQGERKVIYAIGPESSPRMATAHITVGSPTAGETAERQPPAAEPSATPEEMHPAPQQPPVADAGTPPPADQAEQDRPEPRAQNPRDQAQQEQPPQQTPTPQPSRPPSPAPTPTPTPAEAEGACPTAPDGSSMIFVKGGRFNLENAPEMLESFVEYLHEKGLASTFEVGDFCFMPEELGEKPWKAFVEEWRRRRRQAGLDDQEGEAVESAGPALSIMKLSNGQMPATGVSHVLARAYVDELNKKQTNGGQWALPGIEEYVVALWRTAENDPQAARNMLIGFYGNALEWTYHGCGPVEAPGHVALGPDYEIRFGVYCLGDETRNALMGLRLVHRR